ncbi:MAG: 50S ribosomal protein L24 [Armatimonadetes bacterium]|nr:50S ribosomal protein L24 [Armatimonadota bacterium]
MSAKRVKPKPIKLKIKTGDTIEIIAGKDKGERGLVIRVDPKRQLVLVEGLTKGKDGKASPLNAVTKHRKPRGDSDQGERMRVPAPLHISKVMLVDRLTNETTRVGRRVEDGKLVRYAKRSDETVDVD